MYECVCGGGEGYRHGGWVCASAHAMSKGSGSQLASWVLTVCGLFRGHNLRNAGLPFRSASGY